MRYFPSKCKHSIVNSYCKYFVTYDGCCSAGKILHYSIRFSFSPSAVHK